MFCTKLFVYQIKIPAEQQTEGSSTVHEEDGVDLEEMLRKAGFDDQTPTEVDRGEFEDGKLNN